MYNKKNIVPKRTMKKFPNQEAHSVWMWIEIRGGNWNNKIVCFTPFLSPPTHTTSLLSAREIKTSSMDVDSRDRRRRIFTFLKKITSKKFLKNNGQEIFENIKTKKI